MVVCSPWNMSYSGSVSRYAHVCGCRGLVSAKGLVHVLSYGTRALTKQRNGGSEVQGAAETVVVGQRRQNSSVDIAGSTQGANCNFGSTGVLGMSHKGCMREESGGNSLEWKDSPAAANSQKKGGRDDPAVQSASAQSASVEPQWGRGELADEAHRFGVASVVRNGGRSGVGGSERGTHRGCTATTAKSPEPGKMAELWAFCAWGVFSWTWNAMWGVCRSFCCFGLGNKEVWSGGVREREVASALIVFLGHPLGMGDGGSYEGRVGGCHGLWGPLSVKEGYLPRIFGGDSRWILCSKKPGLEILLVRSDVESKCAEVGWVRNLWFRLDGVMNMC
uniref:Uncharacterized protein n=1 Tax=Oryza punctata TaxID=4537 RepID=A0A0E0JJ70_ORYPU